MFTGIIETIGEVVNLREEGTNLHIGIRSAISKELKVDQSVSHNGVCLTVTQLSKEEHWHDVTAIKETLDLTNLGELKVGDIVNLERCMPANGRFDGHIVQGHVDGVATCTKIEEVGGSWYFSFAFEAADDRLLVPKGSICVDGTSLTVVNPTENSFQVAIIPYTYEHTRFGRYKEGDTVNLEFDILGKYIAAMYARREK